MKENTNTKQEATQEQIVVALSPEEQAKLQEEKEHQDKLLKSIKSKEQIQSETIEKLKASSANGLAVATALANSIPNSHEKKPTGPIVIRRFEVTLYEDDEDDHTGQMVRKVVNGGKPEIIEAKSQTELNDRLQLYKQCGQIPVVKEIGQPRIIDNGREITHEEFKKRNSNSDAYAPVRQNKVSPKIYKIGGIEIKNDNGKIYQKQWVQLSETEAKNIRVVNDKTNGIVSLKGKHVEMMKWILVENSDEDETTSLEESINE